MIVNSLGRELPERIGNYVVRPYMGPYNPLPEMKPVVTRRTAGHRIPGDTKLLGTLEEAIVASGLQDGMTISFHHSFREGDQIIGKVLAAIRNLGIKSLMQGALSKYHSLIGILSLIFNLRIPTVSFNILL